MASEVSPPGDGHGSANGMAGVLIDCGPCPYLPQRRFHAFHILDRLVGSQHYRHLLDHGFRRSGAHFYRPLCAGCNECRPIRVDVAAFRERRDQRRCRQRNADLTVDWHPRGLDPERRALYHRYQALVHDDAVDDDPSRFLVSDGGVTGGELHARDATGRLLAVSLVDHFADALSSVYCYYDPDHPRRSLGTYMALAEIDHARSQGLDWVYLGFLVRGCQKMHYKARFMPHEILEEEGWIGYGYQG